MAKTRNTTAAANKIVRRLMVSAKSEPISMNTSMNAAAISPIISRVSPVKPTAFM